MPHTDIVRQSLIEPSSQNMPLITDEVANKDHSPVLDFYSARSVFVTGFSGFLGKVLVEKLLRNVDVKHIYVLMRGKRGITPQDRIQAILSSPPFTLHDKTLLNSYKVIPVEGDLSLPDLGIDPIMKKVLCREVSVVFHSAADVRFDADISSNLTNNVKGTDQILNLCQCMENLVSLVHVSTAYSFCDRKHIEEKVHEMNFSYENVQKVLSSGDQKLIDEQCAKFLEGRPNSYTLTKAMSERLVSRRHGNISTAIVRPAIITPAMRDPITGWVDTVQGFQGITLAAQIGLLQTVDWNFWAKVDIIPVDFCANFAIVAGWYTAKKRSNELVVYNLTLGSFHDDFTWGKFFTEGRDAALRYPSTKQLRPLMSPPKYERARWTYPIERFIYHTFFALIIDLILSLLGYNAFMSRQAKKLNKGLDLVEFFTTHEFEVDAQNYAQVIDALSTKDYELFLCDPRKIDMKVYATTVVRGFRRFFLKEDDKNIPKARKQVIVVCLLYRLVQLFFLWIIGKGFLSLITMMIK